MELVKGFVGGGTVMSWIKHSVMHGCHRICLGVSCLAVSNGPSFYSILLVFKLEAVKVGVLEGDSLVVLGVLELTFYG